MQTSYPHKTGQARPTRPLEGDQSKSMHRVKRPAPLHQDADVFWSQQQNRRFIPNTYSLAAIWLLVLGLSYLTSIPMRAHMDWYHALPKSRLTPPDWVFSVVWPVLYSSLAFAFWRVWRTLALRAQASTTIALFFALHMATNYLWTYMFFVRESPGMGFYWQWLVDVGAIMLCLWFTRIHWIAGVLLLPYLGWLGFATYLNWVVWNLTPTW